MSCYFCSSQLTVYKTPRGLSFPQIPVGKEANIAVFDLKTGQIPKDNEGSYIAPVRLLTSVKTFY
jgi:hypothetical protein